LAARRGAKACYYLCVKHADPGAKMRWYLLIAAMLSVVLLAGCGASHGGIYPFPVYNLNMGDVTLPEGTLTAGDTVDFTATWNDGRDPFQVTWDFDSGADPAVLATGATVRTHTITVELVNDGTEAVEYSGSVVISDQHLREVHADFMFTVEPAP
jgi:hypothetical protein